jgi:hypothetical protein
MTGGLDVWDCSQAVAINTTARKIDKAMIDLKYFCAMSEIPWTMSSGLDEVSASVCGLADHTTVF